MVHVIDDDRSMRQALSNLLEAVGVDTRTYASAEAFLEEDLGEVPSCLILDVRLPGTSGLNFQQDLSSAGVRIPIIFITAHGDIPMSVQAMKAGAVEFLPKPFRDQDLLDAVELALKRDRARLEADHAAAGILDRYATLTPREREVFARVAQGLLNKQIAAELGIAEITVKIHRGNLARKLGATSVVDLVKIAQSLSGRAAENS